jgi:hypothetical protein
MASQVGRAKLKVRNVETKWTVGTASRLIQAYDDRNVKGFKIGGVRIPTATAFMRFLFPDLFGIVDSRVASLTNNLQVTRFSLRKHKTNRNYVNDTKENVREYTDAYIPFLRKEAQCLNDFGARFHDVDASGAPLQSVFRPCDIEMALWEGNQP